MRELRSRGHRQAEEPALDALSPLGMPRVRIARWCPLAQPPPMTPFELLTRCELCEFCRTLLGAQPVDESAVALFFAWRGADDAALVLARRIRRVLQVLPEQIAHTATCRTEYRLRCTGVPQTRLLGG
jgi:hypothetical protein